MNYFCGSTKDSNHIERLSQKEQFYNGICNNQQQNQTQENQLNGYNISFYQQDMGQKKERSQSEIVVRNFDTALSYEYQMSQKEKTEDLYPNKMVNRSFSASSNSFLFNQQGHKYSFNSDFVTDNKYFENQVKRQSNNQAQILSNNQSQVLLIQTESNIKDFEIKNMKEKIFEETNSDNNSSYVHKYKAPNYSSAKKQIEQLNEHVRTLEKQNQLLQSANRNQSSTSLDVKNNKQDNRSNFISPNSKQDRFVNDILYENKQLSISIKQLEDKIQNYRCIDIKYSQLQTKVVLLANQLEQTSQLLEQRGFESQELKQKYFKLESDYINLQKTLYSLKGQNTQGRQIQDIFEDQIKQHQLVEKQNLEYKIRIRELEELSLKQQDQLTQLQLKYNNLEQSQQLAVQYLKDENSSLKVKLQEEQQQNEEILRSIQDNKQVPILKQQAQQMIDQITKLSDQLKVKDQDLIKIKNNLLEIQYSQQNENMELKEKLQESELNLQYWKTKCADSEAEKNIWISQYNQSVLSQIAQDKLIQDSKIEIDNQKKEDLKAQIDDQKKQVDSLKIVNSNLQLENKILSEQIIQLKESINSFQKESQARSDHFEYSFESNNQTELLKLDLKAKERKVKELQQYLDSLIRDLEQLNQIIRQENYEKLNKSNVEEQLNLEQGRNDILRKHCQELESKVKNITNQNNLSQNLSFESSQDTEKVKRNKNQEQNKQIELDKNNNIVQSNSKNYETQKSIQYQDQIINLEKQVLQLKFYENQDKQNQVRIKELNDKINQLQIQNLQLEDKINLNSKVYTNVSAEQKLKEEDEKKMIALLVQIKELNKIINSYNSKEQQLIEENSLLKSQQKAFQDLQSKNEELLKFQKNYIKEKQIIEDRLKDLDKVIETNNSQYKNKIEEQRMTIKNLEKRIYLFKSQNVNNIKDKTNFEQDFYSLQNINSEYSQQIQKLKNEIEVLQVKYKQLQVDNSQLKVQSEQQSKVFSQDKKEFGELQFQLNQANSKILLLENQIKQKIATENGSDKQLQQSEAVKGNEYFTIELLKLQADFKNQDKKLEQEKNQNLILQNNIINLQNIVNQKQQELINEKDESNNKFNLLEQNVNGLIQQNQSLKQQISEKTQSLQLLQNNYDKATKKLNEKEKNKSLALSFGNNELRIQQIECELNEKNNLIQNKDFQIKKLLQVQELYEKQQSQLNQLVQDSVCLQQELSRSKEEFNKKIQEQIDLESQIFNYKEQIFKLELQLKKYQSNLNVDNIPNVANTPLDQNEQRNQHLLNQIQKISSQNFQLKQNLDLVIEQNNKLADEVLLQKNQMNQMNQQIVQYQQTISQLEDEQNEKTKKQKKTDSHSNSLEQQIRELEDQIKSKDLLVNSIQLELDNYRITSSQKIKSIQNSVDEKTKMVEKLEQIYQESEKNFQKHLVELSNKDQAIQNLQIQNSALESKNLHVTNDLNLIQQRETMLNSQVKQLVQENSQLKAQKIISDANQMNLSALIKENQILKEQHLTKIALIKYQVKNLFNHVLKQSIEKLKQITLQKEQQLQMTIQILQQQLQEEKSKYQSLQTTYSSQNKRNQEQSTEQLKSNEILISNKFQSSDLIQDPQQIVSCLIQVVNDNASLKTFIEEVSTKILQMQENLHNSLELLWKEQNVFMSCNLDTQEEQNSSLLQHHQVEQQVKQIIQNLNQLKISKDDQNISSGSLNYQHSSSLPVSLQAINNINKQQDDDNNQSCLLKQITQFAQNIQQELETVLQQIEFLEKQSKLLKNQQQITQKENNKLLIELKVVKEQYINTKYSTILHSAIKQEGEQSQELNEQYQNTVQKLTNANISEQQKIAYLLMQNRQLIETIKTFQINEVKRSEQLNSSNLQLIIALKDKANFKSKNFNFETKIHFFESEQSII
ncbi:hypothetical protein ABPG72_014137 [Tetrahymena utriculariae]